MVTVKAGLREGFRWPSSEVTRTLTIITTPANATIAELHSRMPAVLEEEDWPVWLGKTAGDPAALLRPAVEGLLHARPVSRRVNAVRNDGPALLEPVTAERLVRHLALSGFVVMKPIHACGKLNHSRTGCIVLSPDSQS